MKNLHISVTKRYRVLLHDAFIKYPIAEEIMSSRTTKRLKSLIEDITDVQPRISLTSDGLKQYKKVAENLGLKHQKCVFHLMKDCREKVKRYLKRTKDNTVTKMSVVRYLTEINNIFRTYDGKECLKRYKVLLEKYDRLPSVIIKVLTKKIILNFKSLTQFTVDNFIPRTSNTSRATL
ncbi:MAG: hypothetical protein LBC39_05325 [Methanobrevibacter sp.]|jgi:hypothetical protein|nr:hypothetical protein [Candidatus Methanovirga aequatorialis]